MSVWRSLILFALAFAFAAAGFGVAAVQAAQPVLEAELRAAAELVAGLPEAQRATAIAARVSQEGHWTLVNAAGEVFTAASPDELKRGWDILLPDAASAKAKPTVFLTASTLFRRREALKQLPKDAAMVLADGRDVYPVLVASGGATPKYFVALKPNLVLEVDDEGGFREGRGLLLRPLDRSAFRIVTIVPAGPQSFSWSPQKDRATGQAMVDAIDPNELGSALRGLKGQTAVIVGRIEGDKLIVKPASGSERALPWRDLVAAASAADVNLLILKSSAPQQPGTRNWLWQTLKVKGLDEALTQATFADALAALAGAETRFAIKVMRVTSERTVLDIGPASELDSHGWTSGGIGSIFSEAVSGLTGDVTHQGALADFRSVARQAEFDRRVVSWLPSWLPWTFGGLLVLGACGWPVARRWWARVWPQEKAADYGNIGGLVAARLIRTLAFVALFLPAVAVVAAPIHLLSSRRRVRPVTGGAV